MGARAELGGMCEGGAKNREWDLSSIWGLRRARGMERTSGGPLTLRTHSHTPTCAHTHVNPHTSPVTAHFKSGG